MQHADTNLARRLDQTEALAAADYVKTMQTVYPDQGAGYLDLGDGACALYAGPGSPISRIAGLGLSGPVSAEMLDRGERFLRESNTPMQMDLCPYADPSLV